MGDSATDVATARRAGTTAVFYNGAGWDRDWLDRIFPGTARHPHRPHAVVASLRELLRQARRPACAAAEQAGKPRRPGASGGADTLAGPRWAGREHLCPGRHGRGRARLPRDAEQTGKIAQSGIRLGRIGRYAQTLYAARLPRVAGALLVAVRPRPPASGCNYSGKSALTPIS